MGETKMKITADTSVLVRAAVQDDAHQADERAGLCRRPILLRCRAVLCELVWLLRRGYKRSAADAASAIHRLINSALML